MGPLVRMSLNMLLLLGIFSFAITGGNSITLEEILEEIEVLKHDNQLLQKNVTELSARIEACEAQNQQQDITIEHNAESASTERDIITIHVHDNALGLADNIQRVVDLRKDLSELQVGTQTDLNQLNETIFEAVTKTQNELNRTQEVLIPGVGSILPWIPSPSPRDNSSLSATIPSGWQRCDGSLILEGQFTGLTTPNLNGDRYFLRGGDDFSMTLMIRGTLIVPVEMGLQKQVIPSQMGTGNQRRRRVLLTETVALKHKALAARLGIMTLQMIIPIVCTLQSLESL